MRLATFNLCSGRTPGDRSPVEKRVVEQRLARAIAELDVDVLALQEVDRAQPRSDRLDLTSVAAQAMGATHYRFVPALVGSPPGWTAATGQEPVETSAYGIALLSRYPVRGWQVARLPAAPLRLPHRDDERRLIWVRDEPRVVLRADLETPDGLVRVVTTHLSFLPLSNGRQLRMLVRGRADDDVPTLLIGDLNMSPRRAERLTGLRSLASGPTFPAHRPAVQLDHVLGDGRLRPTSGGPVALAVSDHRALVVDLRPA